MTESMKAVTAWQATAVMSKTGLRRPHPSLLDECAQMSPFGGLSSRCEAQPSSYHLRGSIAPPLPISPTTIHGDGWPMATWAFCSCSTRKTSPLHVPDKHPARPCERNPRCAYKCRLLTLSPDELGHSVTIDMVAAHARRRASRLLSCPGTLRSQPAFDVIGRLGNEDTPSLLVLRPNIGHEPKRGCSTRDLRPRIGRKSGARRSSQPLAPRREPQCGDVQLFPRLSSRPEACWHSASPRKQTGRVASSVTTSRGPSLDGAPRNCSSSPRCYGRPVRRDVTRDAPMRPCSRTSCRSAVQVGRVPADVEASRKSETHTHPASRGALLRACDRHSIPSMVFSPDFGDYVAFIGGLDKARAESPKSPEAPHGGSGHSAQKNAMKLSATGEAISRSTRHGNPRHQTPLAKRRAGRRTRSSNASFLIAARFLSSRSSHSSALAWQRPPRKAVTSMTRLQIRLRTTVGKPKTALRHRQKGGCPNGPIPFFPVISTTIQKGAL